MFDKDDLGELIFFAIVLLFLVCLPFCGPRAGAEDTTDLPPGTTELYQFPVSAVVQQLPREGFKKACAKLDGEFFVDEPSAFCVLNEQLGLAITHDKGMTIAAGIMFHGKEELLIAGATAGVLVYGEPDYIDEKTSSLYWDKSRVTIRIFPTAKDVLLVMVRRKGTIAAAQQCDPGCDPNDPICIPCDLEVAQSCRVECINLPLGPECEVICDERRAS